MPKLTFKTRLSWWFSIILATSLFFSGLIFAISYFWVSLTNLENFMIREGSEVVDKHIVVDKEILFKKDSQNKSLSAYLRDENLSALVIDKDQNIIGAYGVYGGLVSISNKEEYLSKKDIDKSMIDGKKFFSFYNLYEGRTYLVLFYPIIDDGNVVGSLILGSDMNIGRQMLIFSLGILALILPISFFFGWVTTHFIVGKLFRPLENILDEMKKFEFGKVVDKVTIEGNPKDELVKLSAYFDEMMERVQEGVKKQKEFISNTSHELKTPLTQSALELEISEMDILANDKEKALKGVVAVRENLKKYGDMINGMLELAKIDGDNSKISNINVHDYISQYIASQKSDKTINIDVNDKLKIRFPENHFRIILSNLLSNALKYGEKSKPINVSFLVNSTGHLVVENEAKNVNKADLKKIWKRFSRLKNADDIDGYGIGLSVVKEITDFHKLTISSKLTGENVVKISIGGFEVV